MIDRQVFFTVIDAIKPDKAIAPGVILQQVEIIGTGYFLGGCITVEYNLLSSMDKGSLPGMIVPIARRTGGIRIGPVRWLMPSSGLWTSTLLNVERRSDSTQFPTLTDFFCSRELSTCLDVG